MEEYVNHSGGAKGSDLEWDRIGREFGFTNHTHWRPEHLNLMEKVDYDQMLIDVDNAAKVLGRPSVFRGVELVRRNWLQVHNVEAIYAIAYIVNPGDKDFKGFENKTGKQIVAGGTGWAVEMAIQKGKTVFVFDMTTNRWWMWSETYKQFVPFVHTPPLRKKYAGIGSREITEKGKNAIREIYKSTKEYGTTIQNII